MSKSTAGVYGAIRRLQVQLIISGIATFSLVAIVGFALVYHQNSGVAHASAALVRERLLRGDVRSAFAALENGISDVFSEVRYSDRTASKTYYLPASREYMDGTSFEGVIEVPVYFDDSKGVAGVFAFRYALLSFIWIFLGLGALSAIAWSLVFRVFRRRLLFDHEQTVVRERAGALSDLALRVAHDIRSPLAALNVVVRESEGLSVDARDLVTHAVSRIKSISEALLDEYRPMAGTEVRKKYFQVGSSLQRLVSEKQAEYRSVENVEIKLDIGDQIASEHISGDEDDLARALSNLINNSVEAMVGTGRVEIVANRMGAVLEIRVLDSGPGIPLRVREQLLRGSVQSTKSAGSGLGLRITQECIERLEGRIEIEGRDIGSSIVIRIPICSVEVLI